MRWLWAWLAAASAGACGSGQKMAWPSAPAETARTAPAKGPQGGPLEPVPARPVEAEPESRSAEPLMGDLLTTPWAFTLAWPVPAVGVNSLFGRRRDPIDGTVRYHAGVDLDATYGGLISAAADGWVSSAGWHAGHGRRVVLKHAGGFQTVYSHLSQLLAVSGTWVRAGQAIGRVGNSGRSTGPHLHFELNRWGEHLDPLDYLGRSVPLDGTTERRWAGGNRDPPHE